MCVCHALYTSLFLHIDIHFISFRLWIVTHCLSAVCSSCQWCVCTSQPHQHNPHLKHFRNDSHANTSRSLLLLFSLLRSHFSLLIAYHHYYLSNLQTFGKFQRMFTAIENWMRLRLRVCTLSFFSKQKQNEKQWVKISVVLHYTTLSMRIIHCINGSLICRVHSLLFLFIHSL